MYNLLKRSKKRKNTLIKLRKGDIKIDVKKSKEDGAEYSSRLYDEYMKKKKLNSPIPISKKTVDILSNNKLNVYSDINNDDETNKDELGNSNQIETTLISQPNNKPKKKRNSIYKIGTTQKDKKEDLYENNNYELKSPKNDFSSDDDANNRTNSFFPLKERFKKTKKNNFNTVKKMKSKLLEGIEEEENKNIEECYNIKIFYEGKGMSINVSKGDKLSNCLLTMQKILFPFHKLSEYDILYKLKVLDIKALYDEKISNIIDSSDGNVTFYLRKKKTDKIKNDKGTIVLIENFPSFTDLANELNNFFEKEKRESNFTVDYRGNICKVNFSEAEKAFSLIIYLTKLKKSNPIYKRLKINMNYKLNVVVDAKKLKQKPIKLFLPTINNNNFSISKSISFKKTVKIQKEKSKNIYNSNINSFIDNKTSVDNNSNNNNSKNNLNSLNNINNYNSPKPTRTRKRYDSCSAFVNNQIFKSASRFNKNRIKNTEISMENYNNKQTINNSKNNSNNQNYNLVSFMKADTNSESADSKNSDDIITKIKSSYSIIDLSKKKNKIEVKKSIIKKDEDKMSPKFTNVKKKSNYYNLFKNNTKKILSYEE